MSAKIKDYKNFQEKPWVLEVSKENEQNLYEVLKRFTHIFEEFEP